MNIYIINLKIDRWIIKIIVRKRLTFQSLLAIKITFHPISRFSTSLK